MDEVTAFVDRWRAGAGAAGIQLSDDYVQRQLDHGLYDLVVMTDTLLDRLEAPGVAPDVVARLDAAEAR